MPSLVSASLLTGAGRGMRVGERKNNKRNGEVGEKLCRGWLKKFNDCRKKHNIEKYRN